MKIQVLFSDEIAFEKGLPIRAANYRFVQEDETQSQFLGFFSVIFLEDNRPEQVASKISKDLQEAGLAERRDFQIVVWQ